MQKSSSRFPQTLWIQGFRKRNTVDFCITENFPLGWNGKPWTDRRPSDSRCKGLLDKDLLPSGESKQG